VRVHHEKTRRWVVVLPANFTCRGRVPLTVTLRRGRRWTAAVWDGVATTPPGGRKANDWGARWFNWRIARAVVCTCASVATIDVCLASCQKNCHLAWFLQLCTDTPTPDACCLALNTTRCFGWIKAIDSHTQCAASHVSPLIVHYVFAPDIIIHSKKQNICREFVYLVPTGEPPTSAASLFTYKQFVESEDVANHLETSSPRYRLHSLILFGPFPPSHTICPDPFGPTRAILGLIRFRTQCPYLAS